ANVLEHIEDDATTLSQIREILGPGGKLVLLVPAMPAIYGTLDRALHHFRRYGKDELDAKLRAAGFAANNTRFLNRPGVFGWYVTSRILNRRVLPKGQLRAFSWLMPLLRRETANPPAFGMSLLAIARKA